MREDGLPEYWADAEETPPRPSNNLWTEEQQREFMERCLANDTDTFDFVFGRDMETVLRDGPQRTFSEDMMKQLGWMVTVFALSRVKRAWDATGMPPQQLRVELKISVSTTPAPTLAE